MTEHGLTEVAANEPIEVLFSLEGIGAKLVVGGFDLGEGVGEETGFGDELELVHFRVADEFVEVDGVAVRDKVFVGEVVIGLLAGVGPFGADGAGVG